jgi:hypothetical protein
MDILNLQRAALLSLDLHQAIDAKVLEYAFGIPDGTHHQPGVELGRRNERLLDVVVHRRLFGRD